jgi:hypothetical protein
MQLLLQFSTAPILQISIASSCRLTAAFVPGHVNVVRSVNLILIFRIREVPMLRRLLQFEFGGFTLAHLKTVKKTTDRIRTFGDYMPEEWHFQMNCATLPLH